MGLEMTNIQFFLHSIHGGGFYKGATLLHGNSPSAGVLVPINRESRGVVTLLSFITLDRQNLSF